MDIEAKRATQKDEASPDKEKLGLENIAMKNTLDRARNIDVV